MKDLGESGVDGLPFWSLISLSGSNVRIFSCPWFEQAGGDNSASSYKTPLLIGRLLQGSIDVAITLSKFANNLLQETF